MKTINKNSKIKVHYIYLLIATCFFIPNHSFTQSAPAVMQWATHLNSTNGCNPNGPDWAENVKRTSDGGYIICGYSNTIELNASNICLGGVSPALYRLDHNGNVMWQKVYSIENLHSGSCGGDDYGSFLDVIETTSGGFAGVGYKKRDVPIPGSPGNYFCNLLNNGFIILTDQNGNDINQGSEFLPNYDDDINSGLPPSSYYTSIIQAPDGEFVIVGGAWRNQTELTNSVVIKTNGINHPANPSWEHNGSNNLDDGLSKVQITNISGNDFNIIIAGYERIEATKVPVSGSLTNLSNDQFCATCGPGSTDNRPTSHKDDIYAARISYNSSTNTFTTVWQNTYANSIFPTTRTYNDFGPYTKGFTAPPGCSSATHSLIYDEYLDHSASNGAADMVITKNSQSSTNLNTIVISAMKDVNQIPGNLFNNLDGVDDCTRHNRIVGSGNSGNVYDDYKDADCYLIRISYSNGSLLSNPPVQVAHLSGEDFHANLVEDNCGNFFIIGAEADNNLSSLSQQDLYVPVKATALLSKVDENFNKIWRRNILSNGLHQNMDAQTPSQPYDYECGFALTVDPDNSVLVCGNNAERGDDMFAIKLSNDEQVETTWDHTGTNDVIDVNSNTTWANNETVKGKVVIHSGATLLIENCTLQFAETRELNDFNITNIHPSGIWVEKGGKLIVREATIRGLATDPNKTCSRDYMWDGITVEGDPTQPETPQTQGQVVLNENSNIQDARCGTRLDTKTFFNNQLETVNATETWDRGRLSYHQSEGNGGGYIRTDGATFLNCRKSVEFLPYPNSNLSQFQNTNFLNTSGMVDPDFVFPYGIRFGNNTFVSMWDVHRVLFSHNLFSESYNLPFFWKGTGITSIDADYQVYANTFEENAYGIWAHNYNPMYTIIIDNQNIFKNNYAGICFKNIDNAIIENNNSFDVGNGNNLEYGVYLENCTGYQFSQNIFTSSNQQNLVPLGAIDYYGPQNINVNEIYSNHFDHFLYAAALEGQQHDFTNPNNGLVLRCNEYQMNGADELVAPNSNGNGIASQQGFNNPIIPTSAANNMFDPDGCQGANTNGLPEGELYNDASSQHFDYWNNQNANGYTVEPIQPCTTAVQVITHTINTPFQKDVNCPDRFQSPTCPTCLQQRMATANNAQDSLIALDDTTLRLQIDYWKSDYELSLNSLISYYLTDTAITGGLDSVIALLKNESSVGRIMQLTNSFLAKGDLQNAQSAVNSLNSYDYLTNYRTMINMIIEMKKDNRNYFDLYNDTDSWNSILSIEDDTLRQGYAQARAIISLVTGKRYPEVIIIPWSDNERLAKKAVSSVESREDDLKNYPNPFNSSTTIEARVSNETIKAFLVIHDYLGKELMRLKLTNRLNTIILNSNEFKSGIYFYSLVEDGITIVTHKLVLTQ